MCGWDDIVSCPSLGRRRLADVSCALRSVMSFVGHEYPKPREHVDVNGSRNMED